jgi:hypothetical protein
MSEIGIWKRMFMNSISTFVGGIVLNCRELRFELSNLRQFEMMKGESWMTRMRMVDLKKKLSIIAYDLW